MADLEPFFVVIGGPPAEEFMFNVDVAGNSSVANLKKLAS